MKNIKFSESITINCSPAIVFDYTQDYENRLQWDTFLQKAKLIEDAKEANIGVKAYCVAKNGIGMETIYVSFNRPKVTAIKMTEGPYMFQSFLGSWNFNRIAEDSTKVTFLYSFKLRFPFNLAKGLIRKILQSNVRQRLQDLKHHLEQQTTTNLKSA